MGEISEELCIVNKVLSLCWKHRMKLLIQDFVVFIATLFSPHYIITPNLKI